MSNNAIILLTTMIVTISIVVAFFYHMSQLKKRDAKTIASDWKSFQNAVLHKRIQAINKYGNLLIWNEHITVEQVREMANVMKDLEPKYKELTDLKWIIYNRRKDWTKRYPNNYEGPY
jgi:inhibitor of KinA sporulation pathway (predicted exonuclease)